MNTKQFLKCLNDFTNKEENPIFPKFDLIFFRNGKVFASNTNILIMTDCPKELIEYDNSELIYNKKTKSFNKPLFDCNGYNPDSVLDKYRKLKEKNDKISVIDLQTISRQLNDWEMLAKEFYHSRMFNQDVLGSARTLPVLFHNKYFDIHFLRQIISTASNFNCDHIIQIGKDNATLYIYNIPENNEINVELAIAPMRVCDDTGHLDLQINKLVAYDGKKAKDLLEYVANAKLEREYENKNISEKSFNKIISTVTRVNSLS